MGRVSASVAERKMLNKRVKGDARTSRALRGRYVVRMFREDCSFIRNLKVSLLVVMNTITIILNCIMPIK